MVRVFISSPTDSTSASTYGIRDFTIQGWNGTAWQVLATITGNKLAKRSVSFAPFSTDRIRVQVTAAAYFNSRIVEVEAWGVPSTSRSNVALASSGASISASSDYGAPASSVAAVIDGQRSGATWGSGGGWEDGTYNAYPDWLQVVFGGARTIDRVVLYTLRDDFGTTSEPGDALTFSAYGVTDFNVEGWTGSAWQVLASVAGNNLVKRTVDFSPFTTDRIRLNVTGSLYFKSRVVELEAWGN